MNISEIIGVPIKIGDIEVAQHDFPNEMTWDEAKKECESLGSGWRLPNEDELNTLYQNKDKIGGFANNLYWSSTGVVSYYAWFQNFNDGSQYDSDKNDTYYVRAIRAF